MIYEGLCFLRQIVVINEILFNFFIKTGRSPGVERE